MRKTQPLIAALVVAACGRTPIPGLEPDAGEEDAGVDVPDARIGTPDAGPGSLSVTLDGPGNGRVVSSPAGIDCGTTCVAQFAPGTPLSLMAIADDDSYFTGWSGDCSGASATCPLVVDSALSVTATFERSDVAVTVTLAGDGSGTVTSSPAGITCGSDCDDVYAYGSTVVLGAEAATGSTFLGWSGDCTGTGPCVLMLDSAKDVTATFRAVCTATPTILGSPGTSAVTVPAGCRAATVKAWGAAGGGVPGTAYYGGGGGFATAKIAITPGENLQLVVGAGGSVAPNSASGGGGGGSTAVARGTTPLVVAGAGGGGGSQGVGGAGGGNAGAEGAGAVMGHGGGGGTQTGPGAGGVAYSGGANGLAGSGASGGAGGTNGSTTGGGGSGGAGWGSGAAGGVYLGAFGGGGGGGGGGIFGGGGGGGTGWYTALGAGGGGGSSFVDHVDSTAKMTTGGSGSSPGGTGDPDYAAGVGAGSSSSGGSGRIVIIWLTE